MHVAALLTNPRVGQPVLVAVLQKSVLPLLLVNPTPVLCTDGVVLAQRLPGVGLVESRVGWCGHVLVGRGYLDVPTANILDIIAGGIHLLREHHVRSVEPVPVVVGLHAVVGVVILQPAEQGGSEEILGLRPDIFLFVEEYIELSPLLSNNTTVSKI